MLGALGRSSRSRALRSLDAAKMARATGHSGAKDRFQWRSRTPGACLRKQTEERCEGRHPRKRRIGAGGASSRPPKIAASGRFP